MAFARIVAAKSESMPVVKGKWLLLRFRSESDRAGFAELKVCKAAKRAWEELGRTVGQLMDHFHFDEHLNFSSTQAMRVAKK